MSLSETAIQSLARDHYGAQGWRLWRNNTGVLEDRTGRPVRYGLANDSPELNRQIKSGDLIGWRPRLITPDMVGQVIAQFVSLECKHEGWKFSPNNAREVAQKRWADMVTHEGGDGRFLCEPLRNGI